MRRKIARIARRKLIIKIMRRTGCSTSMLLLYTWLLLTRFLVSAQDGDDGGATEQQELVRYIEQLTSEKNQLDIEKSNMLNTQNQLEVHVSELSTQLGEREGILQQLQSEVANHRAATEEQSQHRILAEQQFAEVSDAAEQLRAQLSAAQQELAGSNSALESTTAQVSALSARSVELEAAVQGLNSHVQELTARLSGEASTAKDATDGMHAAREQAQLLSVELQQTQQREVELQRLLGTREAQLNAALSQHDECSQLVVQHTEELGRLQQVHASSASKAERHIGVALKSLIKAILYSFLRLFGLARK